MARRSRPASSTDEEVAAIKKLLDEFLSRMESRDLRDQVRSLVPAMHRLRDLGSSLIPKSTAASARDRIQHYMSLHPRTPIDGDELLVISGIGEWARRVRELRVQFGWWIYSGVTFQEIAQDDPSQLEELRQLLGLDPRAVRFDQYVLLREDQDRDAAHRWNVLNGIRKQPGAVKGKILSYLRANVGKPVSGEELRYLAGDNKEWARRIRELRTEDGWPVYSKMQGVRELPVGAYVLDEDKQAVAHDRNIPDDVRVDVLRRDGFKCTACGWHPNDIVPGDPRKFLELHHLHQHAHGGDNSKDNLVTLCNVHHDSVHRGELVWIGSRWDRASI
jgi:hypothetical protein